jgi:hypothetical protein
MAEALVLGAVSIPEIKKAGYVQKRITKLDASLIRTGKKKQFIFSDPELGKQNKKDFLGFVLSPETKRVLHGNIVNAKLKSGWYAQFSSNSEWGNYVACRAGYVGQYIALYEDYYVNQFGISVPKSSDTSPVHAMSQPITSVELWAKIVRMDVVRIQDITIQDYLDNGLDMRKDYYDKVIFRNYKFTETMRKRIQSGYYEKKKLPEPKEWLEQYKESFASYWSKGRKEVYLGSNDWVWRAEVQACVLCIPPAKRIKEG